MSQHLFTWIVVNRAHLPRLGGRENVTLEQQEENNRWNLKAYGGIILQLEMNKMVFSIFKKIIFLGKVFIFWDPGRGSVLPLSNQLNCCGLSVSRRWP
jgi:hypothetical protein